MCKAVSSSGVFEFLVNESGQRTPKLLVLMAFQLENVSIVEVILFVRLCHCGILMVTIILLGKCLNLEVIILNVC